MKYPSIFGFNHIAIILSFLIVLLTFNGNASAQKVRLRSQITPNCEIEPSFTNIIQDPNYKFADIYADGNIAVQGGYGCSGAFIYDITNPDSPVLASRYNPTPLQGFLEAIVVGNRGYFGSGSGNGGVHIVDLTNPYNPVLLGVVDPAHGNGHNKIHEMVVFNQNGATYLVENYNLLSSSQKILKFINVSNPANPVFIRDLNPSDTTWVHAMHIRGNRMYTSGWGGRIEIYDISNIATQAPTLLGTIEGNSTNHSTWTSEDGNYLYSCRETQDGDLRVYDVSNPASPLLIKSIKASDLGINAITPHNPVVMGNYLYVAWYQAGIQVFDLTNPSDPKRVGQYDTFQPAFVPPTEAEKQLLGTDPWDLVCGVGNRQSALPGRYDGNWAVFPFLGQNKILAGDLKNGLIILDASKVAAPNKNQVSDFDGDGRTDLSTFTPATGLWNSENSSNNSLSATYFGLNTDQLAAGDYDGDGKSDIAVWRPSEGVWYILGSNSGFRAQQFGTNGDVPVEGDYDADGKTDLAVFRPSNGTWYMQQSSLGFRAVQWGSNTDKPVVGDFEGDGKTDLAVFRPSNGTWYILQSSSSLPISRQFGTSGDKPVSGDFDGDAKSDFAVYRPSEGRWYILNSLNNSLTISQFGLAGDTPIPADYDGDGKADIAVYRPENNVWYRLNSANGAFFAKTFGQAGDMPSPQSVQPQ